jgi:hypothetical protein
MAEVIQEAVENTPYWIEGDPGTHQDPYANAAAALSAAGFGLVADAKAEALEEAAAAIETQRDKSNPDRKPEEGWSVIDHRAGRFLGKTVAARLLRNHAAALRGDS